MEKSKQASPYLSVVLPSYNEMQNVKKDVLEHVHTYLKKQKYAWELILTDDGSMDGTAEALRRFAASHSNVSVLLNKHRGKGPTVYAGMFAASGDNRLFADFDQATPIEEVEKLLPFINEGYDVVIGSRGIEGAKREKEPFYRHMMGKGWNMFVQLLAIRGIQDTQCGFKLFTASATERLFPLLSVYKPGETRRDAFTGAFDVELLYLARKKHMKIAEVPVFWKYVKTVRVDPIKDSIRMFIDLVRIRLADVRGKYSER